MRSCSSAATASSCASAGCFTPRNRPCRRPIWNSVTRSTRCTGKPQLRAMSVAFDAQGEMVPRSGETTNARSHGATENGAPSCRSASARPRSLPSSGASLQTTCRNRARTESSVGATARSLSSSAADRNCESALPPSKKFRCLPMAIARGGEPPWKPGILGPRSRGPHAPCGRCPRGGAPGLGAARRPDDDNRPMTISIKSEGDVEGMRVAGRLASEVLDMLTAHVKPGVTTEALDKLAHDLIVNEQHAIPAPLNYAPPGYKPYPKSICTSINHQVCHGIPNDRPLKNGDIVNIDVTVIKDGWHGDTSRMFVVGEGSIAARRLIAITYDAMWKGIVKVKPGAHLGDIGNAIQTFAESQGFSIVREFCGHGLSLIHI